MAGSRGWRPVFAALCLSLLAGAAAAKSLALSFDDGLDPVAQPQAAEWNARLLDTLRQERVQAMLFPALRLVGGPAGMALVADWARAGHAVGNHTVQHRNLASPRISLQVFTADVQAADEALRHLPTFKPMLRFPYLKEGDTADKRDGMRRWMAEHGYRVAPVSIDTSDWYYSQVYQALLQGGLPDRAARLRQAYVQHLLERADHYEQLARRVLGRSPAHVMLLHTNALNADALGLALASLRDAGWTLVPPEQAFADPLYQRQPDALPAGESILWALAKAQGIDGLRYPAEDSVYEEPVLRQRGLLPPAVAR